MKKIDLHTHTNISDGFLTPEEVVKIAKLNKCYKISITDHEIIKDYKNLSDKYKITIVPGIEFNTSVSNLHILGYGIEKIEEMNNEMYNLRKYNELVSLEVIKKLENDNFDISVNQVKEYMMSLNIDSKMMDKRKIVKYLIYKKYANSVLDAYNSLIGKGAKYYVPNKKKTVEEIIELIRKYGGVSVLAHPNTLRLSNSNLIKQIKYLKSCGLNGIEIINGRMINTNIYSSIAQSLNLLETVGSDFHDPKTDNIGIEVNEKVYSNVKKIWYN